MTEPVREALRLVQSGEVRTIAEASRLAGANPKTVAKACERRGVVSSVAGQRRKASRMRSLAVEMVRRGATLTLAASTLGISTATVSDACSAAGVEVRRGATPLIDKAVLRAAWHLVMAGEVSMEELGKRWGVTASGVRKAAKRLGLPATGRACGPWGPARSRRLAAKG